METKIEIANREDLPAILELQYICFREEAAIANDFNIPPLRQTLQEIKDEYDNGIFLKAVLADKRIIGSVRAQARNGTLHIGKLIVHPDFQGLGHGKKLLTAIENLYPELRYELFTGAASVRNIALYERAGYKIFKKKQLSDTLALVFLEK